MEEACAAAGDQCPADGKDLSWLFTSLLNRGGALQVEGTWTYDAASKQVQVMLDQTQTSGLYRMPIEIRITRVSHVVQLSERRHTFSFPSDVEPANVELDPEAWVMMRASFVKK
jgi:hypothetical protein